MTGDGRQIGALERSKSQPAAFELFYDQHAERVLAFFARRTFDVEAARDLMAETFAEAYQHRRRFRGHSEEEAAGWLYGIARHQLSHYVRRGVARRKAVEKLGIRLASVSEDDHERLFELAGLAQVRGCVTEAFAALGVDQQQALKLRVIDELSYPEVARMLAVSEAAARARVCRALRALADGLAASPTLEEESA